jgi:AraC family transcriptional regulator
MTVLFNESVRMDVRIETLSEKKLVGKQLTMSLSNNRTFELWHSFMPRRREIKNVLSTDLLSMQVYDASYNFKDLNPNASFQKWAATEVSDFNNVPSDMETYILEGGVYAVFIHKGPPSAFEETFSYIFGSWLPQSQYELDNREHFELLGEKYKNNDPSSEEEVWIPIKRKD